MDEKKRTTDRRGTTTTTVEETVERSSRPITSVPKTARDRLTAKEEQVIRMRYGIPLSPDQELEFRGQDFEETRVRLALIEQRILQSLRSRRADSKKDKIIDKLTKL